jgi:hypothetical protein
VVSDLCVKAEAVASDYIDSLGDTCVATILIVALSLCSNLFEFSMVDLMHISFG